MVFRLYYQNASLPLDNQYKGLCKTLFFFCGQATNYINAEKTEKVGEFFRKFVKFFIFKKAIVKADFMCYNVRNYSAQNGSLPV